MASSPACSSASPSTSTAAADLQETDAFSDDSGVDVKPQCKKPYDKFLKFTQEPSDMTGECNNKRNKRKSSEPKKRKDVLLMKRFRWDTDEEDNDEDTYDALERERPSSGDSGYQLETATAPLPPTSSTKLMKEQPEAKKKRQQRQWRKPKLEPDDTSIETEQSFRQSVIRKHDASSNHSHSSSTNNMPSVSLLSNSSSLSPTCSTYVQQDNDVELDIPGQEDDGNSTTNRSGRASGRPRNYKSMTRQRRIEANARERTRVHTISAAFENLRRAVPAYAHNQKLSKLAILRIASAYIVALACLSEQDYSQEQSQPSLQDCVEHCTQTIQAEGRSRRRTSKD